ncbi:adenylate/guanylate cyclase [Nitzschia inconspicua]|uniref:Adenylate/guanylate cyclase n=1 Tax=Nitzschia inconspicua TaxID=303405 RepID=A0A9K3M5L1_9STRA|nr:adenylate/guanylate cyclase [Nitzschia inconspicua]
MKKIHAFSNRDDEDKINEEEDYAHDSFREYNSSGGASGGDHNDTKAINSAEISREEVARLALQETKNVKVWRRNVLLMILIMGALVTTLTYIFLRDEENEDFDTAFASTLEDSIEFHISGVLEATAGLSRVLTSEADKKNETWPFVTLSSFEVYVGNTRAQASSELIVVAPIVTKENIESWNEYSREHQGWIDESFAVYGGRTDPNPIPSTIYRFGRFKGRTVLVSEDGEDGYPAAPFWQMSRPPFDTSIVNFNSLSTEPYQEAYDFMMSTRHFVFGQAGANELIDYTISQEDHDALHIGAAADTNNNGNGTALPELGYANNHPHTPLIYPVFQELGNVESQVVAMSSIFCRQAFTYRIQGNDAKYMGVGDLHDLSYDENLKYEIDIAAIVDNARVNLTATSTTDSLNRYWLNVYPSSELESEYTTNLPMIFALVSGCGFLLMALTFLLYDYMVIRKNKKILDTAARSNAILSSLFPKEVKERLMDEKNGNDRTVKSSPFGVDSSFQRKNEDYDDGEILTVKPIADLFPNTTVLFADIVGFTAWSSTREPSSVFVLLETLFRAFDKIAVKRNVFKVETIGDCYVAVTGLPEPRADHAQAMARFAQSCLFKMQMLTKKLEEVLGPDTSTLSMRFGLHSGPVTAGVLRGEKARFQILLILQHESKVLGKLGESTFLKTVLTC